VKHGNKNLGNKTARKIEERMGLPNGYMDSRHNGAGDNQVASDESRTLTAVINQMPAHVKNQLRRLVYAMASEMQAPDKKDDDAESGSNDE
jgi:hypothetical protein